MNDLRVACKKADEGVNRAGNDISSGICSLPASEKCLYRRDEIQDYIYFELRGKKNKNFGKQNFF